MHNINSRVLAENIGSFLLSLSQVILILLTGKKMTYFAANRKALKDNESGMPFYSV